MLEVSEFIKVDPLLVPIDKLDPVFVTPELVFTVVKILLTEDCTEFGGEATEITDPMLEPVDKVDPAFVPSELVFIETEVISTVKLSKEDEDCTKLVAEAVEIAEATVTDAVPPKLENELFAPKEVLEDNAEPVAVSIEIIAVDPVFVGEKLLIFEIKEFTDDTVTPEFVLPILETELAPVCSLIPETEDPKEVSDINDAPVLAPAEELPPVFEFVLFDVEIMLVKVLFIG